MPKKVGQGDRKSTTRGAVAVRKKVVAETYLATGGDTAATAAKHKLSVGTVRGYVRGLDEELIAAMERAQLNLDGLVAAYKEALAAEKTIVSPLGHILGTAPDHALRVMSADKFLNVLVKLRRQTVEAEGPGQLPAPPISIEDFRALPDGERIRVLMQQKTVVIERQAGGQTGARQIGGRMTDDDRWAGMSEAEIEAVMVDRFFRSVRGEAFRADPAGLREQIEAQVVSLRPPLVSRSTTPAFLPIDPPAEHTDDADCWCGPVLEYVGPQGQEVWAHRDGNGAAPPPVVIAQAIVEALMDGEEA